MRQIRIILGGIISLISYFGWIFILTAVSFIFLSEKGVIFGSEVVKSTITINPIFNWLMAGLFPVFFFASQYILCNNFAEYEEKINFLRDIKITLTHLRQIKIKSPSVNVLLFRVCTTTI